MWPLTRRSRTLRRIRKSLSADDLAHLFTGDYQARTMRSASLGEIWGSLGTKGKEQVYRTHTIVYACVQRIVRAVLEAPMVVGKENNDGQWEADQNHDIMNLVYRPNGQISYGDLLEFHVSHLLLTGKSFVWKWRDNSGKVAELWPIPSSWAHAIPFTGPADENEIRRFIAGFVVRVPGRAAVPVRCEDMVYSRLVDPSTFVEGVGPLEAAHHDYTLDRERENYLVEMLHNLHVPGMILRQEDAWTQQQREDLKAVLAEAIGPGRRGKPLTISGKDAGVEFPAPLKDLDWPGLTNLGETRICAAFGVPPLLVGCRAGIQTSALSGPNYEAAEKVLYRGTVTGLWEKNAHVFTKGLLEIEGDSEYELRHDTTGVRALQRDLKDAKDIAVGLWEKGLITRNEARELVHMPPDPEEDRGGVYAMPVSLVEVSDDLQGGGKPEDRDERPEPWDDEENENEE